MNFVTCVVSNLILQRGSITCEMTAKKDVGFGANWMHVVCDGEIFFEFFLSCQHSIGGKLNLISILLVLNSLQVVILNHLHEEEVHA